MARVHLPVIGSTAPPGGGLTPLPGASASRAAGAPLIDPFLRRIRYLRVSVTDRCNYRCSYCAPDHLADQVPFRPRGELLTFEELHRIITIFSRLGVQKVRLTGGEPTMRHGIVELVRRVATVAGIRQVVMTTNGHILEDLAPALAAAGLRGVNVSVDTLDPERFRRVTGRGDLSRVLAGIDAARQAGMRVQTNAVAIAGLNDDEIGRLCGDAWQRRAVPRFIEHMPMSDGALYSSERGIPARAIRAAIEADYGALLPVPSPIEDSGPARYWALARDPGRIVGIISAMTEHFCDDCNRLRLTSTGELHACLGHDDATPLRDLLRRGGSDGDVARAIAAAVSGKRAGHDFGVTPPAKHMIGIGG